MNKLPPQATRVFQGKIFDVYQWKQRLYDGSTAIFERLKRPDTAQVIAVTEDKQTIIQEQEQPDQHEPFISLPGGRVDMENNPLVAAKRELLEETGYASDDWELLSEQAPHSKIIWTVYTYIARRCRKQQEPQLDKGEKIALCFVSYDELLQLAYDERFRDPFIKTYLLKACLETNAREQFHTLLMK